MNAEKQKQFNDSVAKVNSTNEALQKATEQVTLAQAAATNALLEHEKLIPQLKTA